MNLPLNFSVYYFCAIKGRSALKQHDAVNMLFRGKYSNECGPEAIIPSVCSSYTNGKRALSRELVTEMCSCPHEELTRRFSLLGLQDYEGSADSLLRLLSVTKPIGEHEMERLLSIASSADPLSFLIEVFLSAVKCPVQNLLKLTADQQRMLQQGQYEQFFDEPPHKLDDVLSYPKMRSHITEDFGGLLCEYEFRQHQLNFPDEQNIVVRYVNPFLKGSVPEGGERRPVITIDEKDLQYFMGCLPDARRIFLIEMHGTLMQLNATLSKLSLPHDNTQILLLLDISPELSMTDIQKVQRLLSQICGKSMIPHGVRVSGKMENTVFLRMFYTDNRLNLKRNMPNPPSRKAR